MRGVFYFSFMKNTLLAIALLFFGSVWLRKILWMSIEEAYELTQTEDRKRSS